MRSISVTGVVTRACRAGRPDAVRLDHVTGRALFVLISSRVPLHAFIGQVVRVSGRELGQVIGTEAPLLEVTAAEVLAPATLLQGGVSACGPAILRAAVPDDEWRLAQSCQGGE